MTFSINTVVADLPNIISIPDRKQKRGISGGHQIAVERQLERQF